MRALRELVARVADAPAPVLIQGETGTGKGLVARALHGESGRAAAPLRLGQLRGDPRGAAGERAVRVRAGRLHRRGARSRRASSPRPRGGTLFLDEIGDMAPPLQAKLLHVIESGTRPAARRHARAGGRRADRGRHQPQPGGRRPDGDLPRGPSLPAGRRLDRAAGAARSPRGPAGAGRAPPRRPAGALSEEPRSSGSGREALAVMSRHAWPGNVRELAHVLERIVLLGGSRGDRRRRSAAGGARSGGRRPAGVQRRDPANPRAAAPLRRLGASPRAATAPRPPRSWGST